MNALLVTAAIVALSHTAVGIDHSLPFVALSRARGWGLGRTLGVTAICGLAHVASSIVIGIVAWWLGMAVTAGEAVEGWRGEIAGWLLLGFGIAYAAWGLRHRHSQGQIEEVASRRSTTFWTLFIVFAFGPCEPLIPVLLYPALQAHFLTAALVVVVFTTVTVLTMLALVAAGWKGLDLVRVPAFERHAHTLAGLAIAASAAGILFLGL